MKDNGYEDNCPSGAAIEISAAQAAHHVAHESLWLAASYQEAIDSATNSGTLPRVPLKLTLWEPPAGIAQRTVEMEPWTDLIQSMYPDDPAGVSDCITCEEVITLQDYACLHGGKSNLFLRTARYGCYHAEAMLATLSYHSLHHCPSTMNTTSATELTSSDKDFATFQHIYRHIGISKSCCPICTKLHSLPSVGNSPRECLLRVLSAHKNISRTVLPPFVLQEIVETLIEWLQGLVRGAVAGSVRKKRRESDRSDGGGDSRGNSPGHKGVASRRRRRLIRKDGLWKVE